MVAFLLINVLAVAAFLPLIATMFVVNFQMGGTFVLGGLQDALLLPGDSHPLVDEFPWWVLAWRITGMAAGTVTGLFLPFLWPMGRVTRWRLCMGAGCLTLAALCGGQSGANATILSLVVTLVALAVASTCAVYTERNRRWAHATILAAMGGTMGMQGASAVLAEPMPGLFVFFVEAMILAGLWGVAYGVGIRVIRRDAEGAAAELPPPVAPPATAPTRP